MKSKTISSTFIIIILLITFTQASINHPSPESYIIEFKESPLSKSKSENSILNSISIQENHIQDISKQINSNPSHKFIYLFNGILINLNKDQLNKIKQKPYIKKIHKNKPITILLQESVPEIKADLAWQLDNELNFCNETNKTCLKGDNIKIAIIDTGVDYNHSDLGGCLGPDCKVIGGYDVINKDNDPFDDHGHGTHCAATAAGQGILNGIAPNAKILAYKVLNAAGSGTEADVMEGVERAVLDGADILSLSLGGKGSPEDPLSKAIDNAYESGVFVTVAAGNYGPKPNTLQMPGVAKNAFTVAAACKESQSGYYCSKPIAKFSSQGPKKYETQNKTFYMVKPTAAAPGVSICAAQHDRYQNSKLCIDAEHIAISGTSMATPQVAGAAAILKQAGYDAKTIFARLIISSKDLNQPVFAQGQGKIDILSALELNQNESLLTLQEYGLEKELQASTNNTLIITLKSYLNPVKNITLNINADNSCFEINQTKQIKQVTDAENFNFNFTIKPTCDTYERYYLTISTQSNNQPLFEHNVFVES